MRSKKTVFALAILSCTLCTVQGMADETVAQKTAHKFWQDQVDGKVKYANDTCGTTLSSTIAWAGFDKQDLSGVSVGQFCGDAVQGIADTCRTSDGKAAVQKSIKKFVCEFGGPGKRAVSVARGTMKYVVDFKAGSNDIWVRDQIAGKI